MVEPVRVGVVLLQLGIVATLAVAVRQRSGAAVVNALVSLAVAVLPAVLEGLFPAVTGTSVRFTPALSFWLAAAGLLHSIGMLGPYESVPWWDHLTHTLSAGVVAALVYAGAIVLARESPGLVLSSLGLAGATLAGTFLLGVFWEAIELVAREIGERYDVEPVLVHYGWRDTALDLLFDLVGALVVVLLDVRLFVPVAEAFPGATRVAMLGGGAATLAGTALLLVAVTVGED
jgi:hypothetical protein